MTYCDYIGCENKAEYSYMGGLLKLCNKHRSYYNYINPRIINLKKYSGRGGNKNNEYFNLFKEIL